MIAVVTGGGRGIGAATVRALAQAGIRVAFCARNESEVRAVAKQVGEPHVGVWGVDVSSADDVDEWARGVLEDIGVPDVIVNNAGAIVRARLEDTDEAAWDLVQHVNLKGTYLVTRAFLRQMRARKSGRIICVSSIAGRQGTAKSVAYCAAKHGVVGFVRALAEELRDDGIAINAVCPGSVETQMLPEEFAPGMPPEDIAETILWLATEAPITLTGSCIDQFG